MARVPRLYVFQISHFCEKAVWACDHKRLRYQLVALLPGPHLLTVRRLAPSTRVPILVDGERAIQDSSAIIDHLDATQPQAPLTPSDPEARAAALAWEREIDREIGEATRLAFYHHALQDPRFLRGEYCKGGPFWGPLFYSLALPVVLRAVRTKYEVTRENADRGLERVRAMFERLDRELATRPYLVGDTFSRADLTLAALAAPLIRPAEHPRRWAPESAYPPAWIEATCGFARTLTAERVRDLYRKERRAQAAPA